MEPFPPQIRPRTLKPSKTEPLPAKTWRQKGAAAGRGTCGAAKVGQTPAHSPRTFPMMAPPAAAVTDTWATHLVRITMGGVGLSLPYL